jgi:hypothetical protein
MIALLAHRQPTDAMLAGRRHTAGCRSMPGTLIVLLLIIAAIIVYTIAKVIALNRLSEQQWEEVDKSKLKEWDDEDDWD